MIAYIYNMRLKWGYFIATVLLFITEVIIAVYVRDRFIRPYGGDVLVVILIYCFVRIFYSGSVVKTAIGVLLFAFAIEFLQYLNFIAFVGLQDSTFARTVIGHSFAWEDIVAYIGGIAIVLVCEYFMAPKIKFEKTDELL